MYNIVADSGCDLFTLKGAPSFRTAPLTINTDSKSYIDDETLDIHVFVEEMLAYKGRSFTACPSIDTWSEVFNCEDGSVPEELYVLTLTSRLSGTYNSACVAAEMYKTQHPETKILVVDSLSVGPEMAVILEKIAEMKQEGKTFEDIEAMIKGYVKDVRLFFAFQSLHNLAQNGRISKIAAGAAGALGIAVYGTASEAGEVQDKGKTRGEKRILNCLMNEMLEAGYKGGKVRISHVENDALATKMMNAIKAKFPDADVSFHPVRGLCAYYCERHGMVIGCETEH